MPTVSIPMTAVLVRQAAASTKFGQPSPLLMGTANRVLLLASLDALPADAVVTSAVVNVWQNAAWSGSHTLGLYRLTEKFTTSTTWGSSGGPAATATGAVSATRSNAAPASMWTLDVTSLYAGFVAGTLPYYGLRLYTADSTGTTLKGAGAGSLAPVLVLSYTTQAQPPTGLHPNGGAVSKAKTVLTAQVPSDTVAKQVQVDPSMNASSPAYDSGMVSEPGGSFDLANPPSGAPAYAGLADAATTYHRWQIWNGSGPSGWSDWAPFSRAAWKTFTVTSPGASTEDPSPVAQGTYGGNVTAFHVESRDALGALVESSQPEWVPGTAVSYGLTKAIAAPGSSGSVVFRVRDDVVRDAVPGDPDYLEVVQATTVTPSGSTTGITGLAAAAAFPRPWMDLTGTRAAGPSDFVHVYRNGVLIAKVPGASCFSGTAFSWRDLTAPPNVPATYVVYAVVNGSSSTASSSATGTPKCSGIWLADPDDASEVPLWGADDQDQTLAEVAVEHQPLREGAPVVRRRLIRGKRAGSLSGTLLSNVYGFTDGPAAQARLEAWAGYDQEHQFRLVLGNRNMAVIIGNYNPIQVPLSSASQWVEGASLSWWEQ